MTNPLAKGSPAYGPKIDLHEWCEEQNRSRLAERMGRWYFVREVDGAAMVDCLEGVDGSNVRLLLDGKLPDFHGWPANRMKGYRKWLLGVAQQGVACRIELPRAA